MVVTRDSTFTGSSFRTAVLRMQVRPTRRPRSAPSAAPLRSDACLFSPLLLRAAAIAASFAAAECVRSSLCSFPQGTLMGAMFAFFLLNFAVGGDMTLASAVTVTRRGPPLGPHHFTNLPRPTVPLFLSLCSFCRCRARSEEATLTTMRRSWRRTGSLGAGDRPSVRVCCVSAAPVWRALPQCAVRAAHTRF